MNECLLSTFACVVCRRSAWCSSKRLTALNRPRRWNSASWVWLTASRTPCSCTQPAVSSSETNSSSPRRWLSSSVLASCLIYARPLLEYVIIIMWLRYVTKMLRSVKFAEDKVLTFLILREKCKNNATLTLILTLITRADWSDKSERYCRTVHCFQNIWFNKRTHPNEQRNGHRLIGVLLGVLQHPQTIGEVGNF